MHILITGAAGGIGSALVREFESQYEPGTICFTLVDVHQDLLGAVGNGSNLYLRLSQDLSEVHALESMLEQATKQFGPVDLLVNNAGIMNVGPWEKFGWENATLLLNVDLLCPLKLMHLVLPHMKIRGQGGVINISSMAGVVPLPGCAYYGAAKAGIAMASECLRAELRDTGVNILTVYPGPVRTTLERDARKQLNETWLTKMIPVGEAQPIAGAIFRAWSRGDSRVVFPSIYGLGFRFRSAAIALTGRFAPQPSARSQESAIP